MSDVIDDFGDPDRSRASRTFSRTAHLLPWAVLLTTMVRLVIDFRLAEVPWPLAVAAGLFGAFVFFVAMGHQDLARICVQCMREVPRNASTLAARVVFLLRISHSPIVWPVLIVVTYLAAVTAVLRFGVGASWTFLPNDLLYAVWVMSLWAHHRLRPWCRFCRRWDDGSGPCERVPNPDPAGVKAL